MHSRYGKLRSRQAEVKAQTDDKTSGHTGSPVTYREPFPSESCPLPQYCGPGPIESTAPGGMSRTKSRTKSPMKPRMCCAALLKQGLTARTLEGSTSPKGGWASFAYSKKEPIPQILFTRLGRAPVRFVTVLHQEGNGAAKMTDADGLNRLSIEIECGERRWNAELEIDNFAINER